jgi:peptidoglycan/xylan/chitin deacetylase (PgdA/CDA1 family)
MNNQILFRILDKTFRYSGLKYFFLNKDKKKNKCPVLHYHSLNPLKKGISKKVFEEHINYLSSTYNIITIREVFQKIDNNTLNKDDIVITFDDGYEDNLTKALPILRKYDGTATVFITTGFIGKKYQDQKMLSKVQILDLFNSGIEVGSHGVNHIDLTTLTEDKLKYEIIESKNQIEDIINDEAISFCYPYGKYNKIVIEMCKKIGYKCACTLFHDFYIDIENILEIPRLTVDYYDTVKEIQAKINGDRHWINTYYKIYYPNL